MDLASLVHPLDSSLYKNPMQGVRSETMILSGALWMVTSLATTGFVGPDWGNVTAGGMRAGCHRDGFGLVTRPGFICHAKGCNSQSVTWWRVEGSSIAVWAEGEEEGGSHYSVRGLSISPTSLTFTFSSSSPPAGMTLFIATPPRRLGWPND